MARHQGRRSRGGHETHRTQGEEQPRWRRRRGPVGVGDTPVCGPWRGTDEEPGAASRGSRPEGAPARWSEVRKTGMRKTGEKEAAV
jgi:hypothetical protein